jgi:hypothetical protein
MTAAAAAIMTPSPPSTPTQSIDSRPADGLSSMLPT